MHQFDMRVERDSSLQHKIGSTYIRNYKTEFKSWNDRGIL